jgi:beta-lactamase class A
MSLLVALSLAFAAVPSHADPGAAQKSDWRDALRQRIERIDESSPGRLGVYVKRLDANEVYSHHADEGWYLGSTVKVAIAIAALRQVDAGKLKLQSTAQLQEGDKIDGPGELVWAKASTRYTIDSLLTRMIGVSDNTAANLLVRTVGQDNLDKAASDMMGDGVKKITDLAQVRYEVYSEIHPDARKLTRLQLVEIAGVPQGPQRFNAVRRALDVPADQLKVKTMEEAYDRYYGKQLNTATLDGYGRMLEKLVRGQALSAQSTQQLFKYMKFGRRGDYRLEGGIPKSEMIIHKTGTQYRRACHMAVINPQDGGAKGIVVTTCAADMDDQKEAGGIFREVGRAVSETALKSMK